MRNELETVINRELIASLFDWSLSKNNYMTKLYAIRILLIKK